MKAKIMFLLISSILIVFTYQKEDISQKIMTNFLKESTDEQLFEIFTLSYQKQYDLNSDLGRERFESFKKNLAKENKKGGEVKFSENFDVEADEMEAIAHPFYSMNVLPNLASSGRKYAPVDWSQSNCLVQHPKLTEGSTNYTGSAALALAASYALCMKNNQTVVPMSVQHVMDCSISTSAFFFNYNYFLYSNGLHTAKDYPFVGVKNSTCNKPINSNPVRFTKLEMNPPIWPGMVLDTNTIYEALTRGPVLVSMNFYQSLSDYKGGILTPPASTGTVVRIGGLHYLDMEPMLLLEPNIG